MGTHYRSSLIMLSKLVKLNTFTCTYVYVHVQCTYSVRPSMTFLLQYLCSSNISCTHVTNPLFTMHRWMQCHRLVLSSQCQCGWRGSPLPRKLGSLWWLNQCRGPQPTSPSTMRWRERERVKEGGGGAREREGVRLTGGQGVKGPLRLRDTLCNHNTEFYEN